MRFLYKPLGLLAGVIGGLIARRLFNLLWQRIDDHEPPSATTEETTWPRVVGGAALEAATFAATKAAVGRAGAKGFERVTGVWPGEHEPDAA